MRGCALVLVGILGACAYAKDDRQPPACQLVPTGGCPSGQACSVDPAAAPAGLVACRDVVVEGRDVAACAAETECAAGWTCQPATGDRRCARYCDDDGDCGGAGGLCVLPVVVVSTAGVPVLAAGAAACTPSCDPVGQTGCLAGLGCQLAKEPAGPRFHTLCEAAGSGGHLAACTDNGDCLAGFTCQTIDSEARCLRRCALAGAACDVAGTRCTAQTSRPTIGQTEYGVCVP